MKSTLVLLLSSLALISAQYGPMWGGMGSMMGMGSWRSPLGMYPWMSSSGLWRSGPVMRMASAGSTSSATANPVSTSTEKIPVLSIAQPLISLPQAAVSVGQSAMNLPHTAMSVAQGAMNIPQNVVNMPKVPAGEEILNHMVLATQNAKPFVDTISDFFYSPEQIKARQAIVTPVYVTGISPAMKASSNIPNQVDDCTQQDMARWNRDISEWVF